jgi:hypothetical protein
MAVSIMLTSCGKSAGLSNGGKKADNKTPVPSPSPKPQPQKNNEPLKKNKQSKKLKSLPELPENFKTNHDTEVFKKTMFSGNYLNALNWSLFSVEDLIYIYCLKDTISLWRHAIKIELDKRGYDVSTLS